MAVTSPYLLSLQLISGKSSFVHHNVHLDVETGKLIKIEDILDTKQEDLFKLLNLLNNNKSIDFTKGLPKEWYIKEDKLFFLEIVSGKEEVAGFALGNLHKFIKSQKWIGKNSDWSVSRIQKRENKQVLRSKMPLIKREDACF